MGKVIKLRPYISNTIWGGDKLKKIKNIESNSPVGESWEVATLGDKSSEFEELKLSNICELNYLVKFIDATKNLSIQVHPDNDYAKENENSKGKTECWLILEAEDDAGIFLGFKPGITKKEFFTAVKNKLAVDKYLNFINVSPGDFFVIPAGTVHSIGAGVTLCEVQQSSGVTYRVWDWNRFGLNGKPRELHIEKAQDVLNFSEIDNQKSLEFRNYQVETGIFTLIEHDDFNVQLFSNIHPKKMTLNLKDKDSIIMLDGHATGNIELQAYESAFVLEGGSFEFEFKTMSSFLVVSE